MFQFESGTPILARKHQAVGTHHVRENAHRLERKIGALSGSIDLRLGSGQLQQLIRLDQLIGTWNRAVPLVGFRTEEERHNRYFLEALHASLWLPEEGEAIDLGSGGGTPALPFAIRRAKVRWTLLEPNRRKALFLEEAAARLGLGNVTVVRSRVEAYDPPQGVRAVTTRGLALKSDWFHRIAAWVEPGGILLLVSGKRVSADLESRLGPGWSLRDKASLAPGFETQILVLARS